MSSTCGPRDIISLVIPRIGDTSPFGVKKREECLFQTSLEKQKMQPSEISLIPADQDIYYGSSVLSHRSDTLGVSGCVLSSDLILWGFLDAF
jgi:hypothetical protein